MTHLVITEHFIKWKTQDKSKESHFLELQMNFKGIYFLSKRKSSLLEINSYMLFLE